MPTSNYVPKIAEMTLYVPASGAFIEKMLLQGSAMVGVEDAEGNIRCYYEGGVYQTMEFSERLSIACGRLAERAPTTAFAFVKPDEVVPVGSVNWDPVLACWIISSIDNAPALKEWTGIEPALGGTRGQRERAAGLIVSKGPNAKAMAAWQAAIGAQLDPVDALIAWAREQE